MGIRALSISKTTIANNEHIEILTQNNISISMDAKGRSIDNIIMERFLKNT
jgi:transposase InsO family protein